MNNPIGRNSPYELRFKSKARTGLERIENMTLTTQMRYCILRTLFGEVIKSEVYISVLIFKNVEFHTVLNGKIRFHVKIDILRMKHPFIYQVGAYCNFEMI
jgi:hypothetical protein